MNTSQTEYFSERPDFPTKTIVFTVFIGAFFGYLNETLLNVALSTLMQEFAVSKTTVQWISTGFLLVMGAFTPITANVIQWFSTRTMLLITLAVFLSGSLMAAFAPTFPVLLAGRMVQAVSAAFTVPVLFNVILLIYPPHRRGVVMGLVTMMFIVAPAIGPTLSGIIVDHFGWRYLFLFTVPFIGLAMILTTLFIKENLQPITKPSIDVPSALMSIFGFGGLVYASSNFATLGVIGAAAMALVSGLILWAFAKRQSQLAEPLVDLSLLNVKQFRYAVCVLALLMMAFIGAELAVPIYLQQVVMLSATTTGLVLFPASVLQAILAPLAGHWLDKKGVRGLAWTGAIMLLTSFIAMLWLFREESSIWLLTTVFALLPASAALLMTAETHGLNALPKESYPHGTAIISTVNPIAGALGAAMFVGLTQAGESVALANADNARSALMSGVNWAFMAGIVLAVLVMLCVRHFRNHQGSLSH
ncbi:MULTISPECIES: DHA2 family efflux MFS transporter permease subunit [Glaesserella]|uniref:MFS transporter n=1 Tax=Glaesserella australis TaxID=2094024 RepID=A0A328C1Y4_9PAST|nr:MULTISPECIES: DHA2 family efflux MFS transporter permease subunit [Glaesserella]AUI66864.1 MFS transporter [Glaesserella sp. 15-184]RAL19915.1 MFS transporter [Glaesserella australis]